MKKFARFTVILSVYFAMILLGGCFSPPHGIAFSPDGKQMIYADSGRDGLVLRDIASGDSNRIYDSPTKESGNVDYLLLGVFWPAGNEIFVVEAKSGDCAKGTKSDFVLKKIDAATRKAAVVAQTAHSCADKNGMVDNALIYSMNSADFDAKTLTAYAGGVLIRKSDKAPSPFAFIPKPQPNDLVLNPRVSPKGNLVAYFHAKGLRDATAMSQLSSVSLDLRLLRLADKKITTIAKLAMPADRNDMDRMTLAMSVTSSVKWKPDGSALFFENIIGGKPSLVRYDLADTRATTLFTEDVVAFDVFPSGDRLLVFYRKGAEILASVILESGTVESTQTMLAPDLVGHSLTVSPDGRHAAAMLASGNDYFGGDFEQIFLPVLYDLDTHKDELLVFDNKNAIGAGKIYYMRARYDASLDWFKKAGDSGILGAWMASMRLKQPEAGTTYQSLLKSHDGAQVDPHILIGRDIAKYSDFDLAEEEFLKADKSQETYALHEAARMYDDRGMFDRALPWWEKALEAFRAKGCYENGNDSCKDDHYYADMAPLDIAQCLAGSGKIKEAIVRLESLKKDYPRTAKKLADAILINLADLHERSGDCKNSLASWRSLQAWQNKQPADWKKDSDNISQIKRAGDAIARLQKQCK